MAVLELIIPVRPKRSHAVLEPACPNCGHGVLGSGPRMPCPECGGDVRDAFRRPDLAGHGGTVLVSMRRTIAMGVGAAATIVLAPWLAIDAGAGRIGLLASAWIPGVILAWSMFRLAGLAAIPPTDGPPDPELAASAKPVRTAALCATLPITMPLLLPIAYALTHLLAVELAERTMSRRLSESIGATGWRTLAVACLSPIAAMLGTPLITWWLVVVAVVAVDLARVWWALRREIDITTDWVSRTVPTR